MSIIYINPFQFAAAPSPGEWTPADTSTVLWYDADDATTISVSGGLVSEWRDKSGNNRHAAQADSNLQPALITNAYNSRPSIRSDGSGDTMPITPFSVSAGIRVYGVVNSLIDNRRNSHWIAMTDNSLSPIFGGAPADWYDNFFSTSRAAISLGGVLNNRLQMTFTEQTGTQLKCRAFGSIGETAVNATFIGNPTNFFTLFLAPAINRSGHDLCEVVMLQSPTTDIQQKTEGYLAHKWGLTADLPVDHPYKTAVPVT